MARAVIVVSGTKETAANLRRISRSRANNPLSEAAAEYMQLAANKARSPNYGFVDRTGILRKSIRFRVRRANARKRYVIGYFVLLKNVAVRGFVTEWREGGKFSFMRRSLADTAGRALPIFARHIDRWARKQ